MLERPPSALLLAFLLLLLFCSHSFVLAIATGGTFPHNFHRLKSKHIQVNMDKNKGTVDMICKAEESRSTAATQSPLKLITAVPLFIVTKLGLPANFLAGGIAGTVASSVTAPLEVIKTQLQSSQFTGQSKSPFVVASTIFKTEGIYLYMHTHIHT